MHLQSRPWYLDCVVNICPTKEEEKKLYFNRKVLTIVSEDDIDDTLDAPKLVAEKVAANKGKQKVLLSKLKALKAPKTFEATKSLKALKTTMTPSTTTDAIVTTPLPSTIEMEIIVLLS